MQLYSQTENTATKHPVYEVKSNTRRKVVNVRDGFTMRQAPRAPINWGAPTKILTRVLQKWRFLLFNFFLKVNLL